MMPSRHCCTLCPHCNALQDATDGTARSALSSARAEHHELGNGVILGRPAAQPSMKHLPPRLGLAVSWMASAAW